MMLSARPQSVPLSLQLRILWWRLVIHATRATDRLMVATLPWLVPLRPFWWVPVAAMGLGFWFGLLAILVIV